MAKQWSNNVRFYFAGFDLGTAATSAGVELNLANLDVTALGDAAERQIAGIRQDVVTWAGIFDDSLSADAAGSAMLGTGANNVVQVHFGTGTGSIGYGGTALLVSHRVAASRSELVMAEGEFKVDGKLRRGQVLLSKSTIDGSGSSGATDGTAASTGTAALFLQVFSYAGGGTTVVTLESASTATGAYTAFATVGGISTRNSYLVTATGTLDRFVRITKNATGTAGLAAVVVRGY